MVNFPYTYNLTNNIVYISEFVFGFRFLPSPITAKYLLLVFLFVCALVVRTWLFVREEGQFSATIGKFVGKESHNKPVS